jgi:cell division protein FtsW (lipid II flippase)
VIALARRAVPDPMLVLAVLGLVALGSLMIRAATMPASGGLSAEAYRHLFYGGVGATGLVAASRLHVGILRRLAPVIYVFSVATLILRGVRGAPLDLAGRGHHGAAVRAGEDRHRHRGRRVRRGA